MSELSPLRIVSSGTSSKPCHKCGKAVALQTYTTPDTVGAYGNPLPGKTFTMASCGCPDVRDETQERVRRATALLMANNSGGTLTPGQWQWARLAGFDWWGQGDVGPALHKERFTRYCETLPERVAKGQGLYLTGQRGLGKSMLVAIVLTEAAEMGIAGRFEPCAGMCSGLSQGDGQQRRDYHRAITRTPILGIDDLGTEDVWGLSSLFSVIDERYSAGRPTLVTTNLSGDELQARYKGKDKEAMGRILDRLMQKNHALAFKGESYRKRLKEEW